MKKTKTQENVENKAKANCLLNVREAPNTGSNIIHVLEQGEVINVYEESGAWKRTDDGWCMSAYLEEI